MKIKYIFLRTSALLVMVNCILLITQPAFTQTNINAQDLFQQTDTQYSVGPAIILGNSKTIDIELDAAIGTRAFTQISSSPTFQFGKSFLESCTITDIGAPFQISFPGGLVLVEGKLYTWNQNEPFQFWRIDTVTGAHIFEFNITGVPLANLSGLTWDGTTMYGVATNLTISQLLTIDIITGVCTTVGTPSTICPGAISISGRLGVSNGIFSVDIISDNLVKWNKTNGAPEIVGPLNVNANYGQDAQFDNSDGKLYWFSSVISPSSFALRTIDTATGSGSTVICSLPAQPTGIAPYYPSLRNYNEVIRGPINYLIHDFTLISDSVLFPFQGSGSVVLHVNYRIINITHTWDADLRMYAQHQNIGAMIVNRVGESGDNFINTVLNDSGIIPIESGVAPFDGTFRPSNPLSVFNGHSPNGYWKLLVSDTAAGDEGVLTGWSIQVTYQNPTGSINTVEIPNYYSLGQNYPNPFNPSTKIKFTLPQTGNVKLIVYDILGREVRTLVNEVKDAGVHEVNFNASSLSSGVYFYRIEAGKYTATKKMLIIK